MHATRLSTNSFVCDDARSIIMARDTLSSPVFMGVSAVYRGKGKGKGHWKDKDKEAAANPGVPQLPAQRTQEALLPDHGGGQHFEGPAHERS